MKDKAKKKAVNSKHDLDYLVSLSFADAIASNETRGMMSYLCRWMFGDTRQFIPFQRHPYN